MTPTSVLIEKCPDALDLPLPEYATSGSAGVDLCSAVTCTIQPGTWEKISTGLKIALPQGYEAQIRSRSGLAAKNGVVVLNAPGTIDADYRGELVVLLFNHGKDPFEVTRGMRCAQLVIAPVSTVAWIEQSVDQGADTQRGEKGFGSTGLYAAR